MNSRSLNVLLVDDDPMNMEVAEVILVGAGHHVTLAANGGEAAAKCHDVCPFDLVLMDLNMPFLNGLEATRAIRDGKAGRHVPIVIVTNSTAKNEEEKALAAGADRFFAKPYRRRQLLEMIEAVMAAHANEE